MFSYIHPLSNHSKEQPNLDFIHAGADNSTQEKTQSPSNAEKDLLRYYYYIHHGIDTEHVAPLEVSSLRNTLNR